MSSKSSATFARVMTWCAAGMMKFGRGRRLRRRPPKAETTRGLAGGGAEHGGEVVYANGHDVSVHRRWRSACRAATVTTQPASTAGRDGAHLRPRAARSV